VLALQTQWPALVGERRLAQLAANVRQTFSEQLSNLRLLGERLTILPAPYWALLQADQAFLDALSREIGLIVERGEALLLEETRATFWFLNQRGQTTGIQTTANQRTILLLTIPKLADVAQYKPLGDAPRTPTERAYRQALPQVIRAILEWLVDGKTLVRWQEERDARRLAQELLRPPPKKRKGGKREGAGRPKEEPTRVLSLRVTEPLYQRLAERAQEAGRPLSVFVEELLTKQFPNE
jgi:hypothetical protein